MRTWMIMILACCIFLSGCGVVMNAQYRQELDEQVVLARVTANADAAGNLTPEESTWLLRNIYVLLRTWQDAQTLKGVPTDGQERAIYIDRLYGELDK